YFAREALKGERLLEKRGSLLDGTIADNRVFGVSRQIEHFGSGTCFHKLLNHFASAHTGHDDVSDDQVEFSLVVNRCSNARLAVFGLQHLVAVGSKRIAHQLANRLLVLHQQNGLCPAHGFRNGNGMLFRRSFHSREVDLERGATSQFALHRYISATLLHDSIYCGKAQPGSLPLSLGGKERLEDLRLRPAVHSLLSGHYCHLVQLLSAERQRLAGQGRGAVGGTLNGAALLEQGTGRIHLRQNDLGIAANDHQQVIEVVSHATGEASNGFHL